MPAPGTSTSGSLDALFAPSCVAVVGASRRPGKLGHDVLVECARLGFAGRMYGVNPQAEGSPIAGWPVVASVADVPGPVDLAFVATPAAATLAAVETCAAAGVRAAVLAAAGLGELGGDGAVQEAAIGEVAAGAGMRLLGPNGFGLFVGGIGLNLMAWRDLPAGRVALVTQSGNLAIALCRLMAHAGIGLASCAGLGNQLDLTAADIVAHHAADPGSDAVALYLEGLRGGEGRRLLAALEACRDRGKPVVVVKGGRSAAGARAAATHTGALSGDGRLWDAALDAAGAVTVDSPEAMVDVLAALAALGTRRGRGAPAAVVLTDGGGDSVLSVDALAPSGVALAGLAPATERALEALTPPAAPRAPGHNPVTLDTAGGLEDDPRLLAACAEAVAADPATGVIVVAGTFGGYRRKRSEELEAADRLAAVRAGGTPLLVQSAFALDDEETVARLRSGGIPVYPTVRRLAAALGAAVRWGGGDGAGGAGARPGAGESAEAGDGDRPAVASDSGGATRLLPSPEAAALLAGAGIAVPPLAVARTRDELAGAARTALGAGASALCLKLEDPAVAHKSDVGGVRLGVGPDEIADAAGELWDRFPGTPLLVMPMLERGLELLAGAGTDPDFGPYVTIGRGGVTAELDPDVALAPAPLTPARARELWSSLRCTPLLAGWRGSPGVDLGALAGLAVALGDLAAAHPALTVECNPVIAYAEGFAIADLRAVGEGDRRAGT